jgi:DNA polymerase III subunit epsilon
MDLFKFLRNDRRLTEAESLRLGKWAALDKPALDTPFRESRYGVVDVETSGLDLNRDRLISIGAVVVENGAIVLGERFYAILQQESTSSRENIEVHGIGGTAQMNGAPAPEVLLSFLEFLGHSPLVAFHVTFDETMIRRAIREYLGFDFKHPWLDLAYLMPALNPERAARLRSLDDWLNCFSIRNDDRHNALSDALATAQLLQVALSQAPKARAENYAALRELEKAQRWVDSVA